MTTTTTITTTLLGLCTLGLGLVLAYDAGSATAWADEKVYSSQFCVPQQLESPPEFSAVEMRQHSGPGYQAFVCPLVRDRVTTGISQVWVRVFNRSNVNQRPPYCCVHAISLGGAFSDVVCAGGSNGFGAQSIAIPLFGLNDYDYGHYAVACDLDDADSIISIRAQE